MLFTTINPFTNTTIGSYESDSPNQVQEKLKHSNEAFKNWRNVIFSEREKYMLKVSEFLLVNKKTYAETITHEMGKTLVESILEIEKCAWLCKYYAENAATFLRTEEIFTSAQTSKVYYQPIGTVLGIMPWNYPFWQVFRFVVPTLMAGNVCILKHATNVLGCAKHIAEIFIAAGFPPGAIQNLFIDHKAVEDILANPIVKAVTLTGSEKAGSSVAATAGKYIKKSLLELGGNNAFIVLSDADIPLAVKTGVKARMQNAGQSCIAAKRFILMADIAEKFIAQFISEVEKLTTGDPMETATKIGPLARVDLAEMLEQQVNDSLAKGAKLVSGGKRNGALYTPAVLTHVAPGMPAFDEELFGPVAAIMVVQSEEEALQLANNSEFGLGASVFTSSRQKADYFIEHIEDGAVFINSMVKSDPRLPFGGTKKSGYGRELGKSGIMEFVNVKTVYIDKGLQ